MAVAAQEPAKRASTSNLRVRIYVIKGDSLVIDSLSIVPNTLKISGVEDSAYRLDFVNAIIYWKQLPPSDTITITYRVFPYRLNAVAQIHNYDSIKNRFYLKPFVFDEEGDASSRSLFNFGNVEYNGSFGRGISFGNNQDAVVNSNLNLQINGMLRDSIEIAAAITDNQIPIQPDGTTQQLNEFDQVFLQFKKDKWKLELGDIDLRQNNLYFLNFYKRLEGISFQTSNRLTSSLQSSTLVSGSIAKGKFTRNIFQGLEGNQGPYRLTGANNEFFFIVLGGTERVFLDGELLQRGEDQDYVINYNSAEVTFTPKRMITKDSRIQVEFEYADRNFLNSNLYIAQSVDVGSRLKMRIGAFQNNDAKNSQINQTLDDNQRRFLFTIGDSINQAFYPTANIDSFSRDRIMYEKVYYLNAGVTDSFYRYSTDSVAARYLLSFTDLGEGQGNYVPEFSGANGKVFVFVPPLAGVKQGRYEPVMKLVTPKRQQVMSVGADYSFNEKNVLKTEVAMSNYDANTFSPLHASNDQGVAARIQYANTIPMNKRGLQLVSNLDAEHVQKQFRPLERLRYVEFSREWGLPLVVEPATENILRFSTSLTDKQKQSLTYQFMTYQRNEDYKGYQNILQHNYNNKGWRFANQVALTTFDNFTEQGKFLRPVVDVSKKMKQLANATMGVRYTLEKNEVRHKGTDTVMRSSFSFDTYTAYIRTDEGKKNRYGINFFTRRDKYPFAKELLNGDRSYNVNLQAEILSNVKHQLLLNTTFRRLDVYNEFISKQKEDRTLLGRAEYMINEWNGFIKGSSLYELGAGQEQRRDFSYIQVQAGRGEYTWIDYNNDGIEQLNEFEIAVFQDQAKYVRIFIPTNEFVKANYNTLNYSFSFTPKSIIKATAGKGLLFLSRFTWQTGMQKTKKSIAKGDYDFNPFKYAITDTALLTLNTSFSNTVSFNRFSSKWGLDLSNIQNSGKSLLTYGYESRKLNDWLVKLRWVLSPSFTWNVQTRLLENELYTPSFANRNYRVESKSVEPQLMYINRTIFRVQAAYKFDIKMNDDAFGGERSVINSLNLDSKYNFKKNASVNGRLGYTNIDFPFPANTTVSYIMLEGLLPGSNYLWSLDLTRRLLNNVELNLTYEGRKPGEARTVHTGRAALRALF